MFEQELAAIAAAMVAPGKGILAIDESSGTVKQRCGQDDERATAHRNAINAIGAQLPWPLAFAYGTALQAPALKSMEKAAWPCRGSAKSAVSSRKSEQGGLFWPR